MLNNMISKAYEKADFQILEFALEDVLTASDVVHTTKAPSTTFAPTTTLPATTVPNNVAGGSGDAVFDYDELFK